MAAQAVKPGTFLSLWFLRTALNISTHLVKLCKGGQDPASRDSLNGLARSLRYSLQLHLIDCKVLSGPAPADSFHTYSELFCPSQHSFFPTSLPPQLLPSCYLLCPCEFAYISIIEIMPPVLFSHAGALGSISLTEIVSCFFLSLHSRYSVKLMLKRRGNGRFERISNSWCFLSD